MNTEFMQALKDLQREKRISSDSIIDALEKALAKSYEKNYNDHQNVKINIDPETGKLDIFAEKLIVDSVEDPIIEISLNDARKINANYQIGETVLQSVTPHDFGRIAAQTARNIVLQKIKDAERAIIFSEFEDREHENYYRNNSTYG